MKKLNAYFLAITFTLQAIVKREVACKFQLRILDSLKSSKRSRSIQSWTVFVNVLK